MELHLAKSLSLENSKEIERAIEKNEFFKLKGLRLTSFLKKENTPKLDINSKKILQKLKETISKNSYFEQTNIYFSFLFNLSLKNEVFQKRKNFVSSLKKNFKEASLKDYYPKNFDFISPKIFPYQLITTNESLKQIIFNQFGLQVHLYSEEELEQKEELDSTTLLISDRQYNVDCLTCPQKDIIKVILGFLYVENKENIQNLVSAYNETQNSFNQEFKKDLENFAKSNFFTQEDLDSFLIKLNKKDIDYTELSQKVMLFEEEANNINEELKKEISNQKLSLEGEDLLELMSSGNISSIQKKLEEKTKNIIQTQEKKWIDYFKEQNLHITSLFSNSSYPLEIDKESQEDLLNQIEALQCESKLVSFKELGTFPLEELQKIINYPYILDFCQTIFNYTKEETNYPTLCDELTLHASRNIFIEGATPITYGFNSKELHLPEKLSIVTGANSGGKTTLLELLLQNLYLTYMGFPLFSKENSKVILFEEIIYLKKFTGTQGSGAFEQTIRNIVEILNSNSKKCIFIDEFEAVTEPGAAAKILFGFLKAIEKDGNYCIAASHLGVELKSLLDTSNLSNKIRIDGISAQGLDDNGNLITNHQPEFNSLGKSTPELILKRILMDESFWKNKNEGLKDKFKEFLN